MNQILQTYEPELAAVADGVNLKSDTGMASDSSSDSSSSSSSSDSSDSENLVVDKNEANKRQENGTTTLHKKKRFESYFI